MTSAVNIPSPVNPLQQETIQGNFLTGTVKDQIKTSVSGHFKEEFKSAAWKATRWFVTAFLLWFSGVIGATLWSMNSSLSKIEGMQTGYDRLYEAQKQYLQQNLDRTRAELLTSNCLRDTAVTDKAGCYK